MGYLDAGKAVFDELIDHTLGKGGYRQPLPKNIMHSRFTFVFTPEEIHPAVAVSSSRKSIGQFSRVNLENHPKIR